VQDVGKRTIRKMIGLFAAITKNNYNFTLLRQFQGDNIENEERGEGYYVYRSVNKKFMTDKVWYSDDSYCVLTDGVIIGQSTITRLCKENLLGEKIILDYQNKSLETLLSEFRGSFSGIIIDKKAHEVVAYTDQFCSKPLFVFCRDDVTIISSSVTWIVEFCKENKINVELNMIGAYSLVTYGYMYGYNTLIKGVKRIPDGSITRIGDTITFSSYHKIDNSYKIAVSEEEAINRINELFTEGIRKQAERNAIEGYVDAIPLSAGMDCRMTSFAFKNTMKIPAVNFTYSETGEYDFTTPPKMARYLHNRWLFKSLDNGLDMANIEEAVELSDGLVYYAWAAQLVDFLKLVNVQKWGIVHTGVLGDIVIGSFVKEANQRGKKYQLGDGAYSKLLLEKLGRLLTVEDCDYEIGMIKNRGINGACMGYSMTFRYYGEDLSPFLYVDLFDYCLSLPGEMRERHNLYYKWIAKYYPQALEYKHNGITPKGRFQISTGKKKYKIRAIPDLIKNTIRSKVHKDYGMNPMQSWYDNNTDLRESMDDYFQDNLHCLDRWVELKQDVEKLYLEGSAREKLQAISLVGSVKLFFG